MDVFIYGYQICQVVPGTRSCQVPDRARYLIVPGRGVQLGPGPRPLGPLVSWNLLCSCLQCLVCVLIKQKLPKPLKLLVARNCLHPLKAYIYIYIHTYLYIYIRMCYMHNMSMCVYTYTCHVCIPFVNMERGNKCFCIPMCCTHGDAYASNKPSGSRNASSNC